MCRQHVQCINWAHCPRRWDCRQTYVRSLFLIALWASGRHLVFEAKLCSALLSRKGRYCWTSRRFQHHSYAFQNRRSRLFSVCLSHIALAHFPPEISAPPMRQQPDKTSSGGPINLPHEDFSQPTHELHRNNLTSEAIRLEKLQQCWSSRLKTIITGREYYQYKLWPSVASNNAFKGRSC